MTINPTNNLYTLGTGTVSTTVFLTVISDRNPTSYDLQWPVQQRWINKNSGIEYFLIGFVSTSGTVLANWIQISGGTTALNSLTGNSGGAISPIAGNINVLGDATTINIVGTFATATLTANVILPATAHVVLLGETSSIAGATPTSTAGIPLVSNGSSSDPSFSTALVPGGGTGLTSLTAYAVMTGGTTSTGNMQQVSGVGTAGQVLTSNGAGMLPSWQAGSAPGGFVWSEKGVDFNAQSGNGYFITAACTATLPSGASDGLTVAFIVDTASSLTIQAEASQFIRFGNMLSAMAGTVASQEIGDTMVLVYRATTSTWITLSSAGDWDVT